jgi:hypothetical protein
MAGIRPIRAIPGISKLSIKGGIQNGKNLTTSARNQNRFA